MITRLVLCSTLLLTVLLVECVQHIEVNIYEDDNIDLPSYNCKLNKQHCGPCRTCNGTTSKCDPNGNFGCKCDKDKSLCQQTNPDFVCSNDTDRCQCAGGFHFNGTDCLPDVQPCGPEPDRNCSRCFHCDLSTDTCLPDFDCHCHNNAECAASDPNMECHGFLKRCQCVDGFSYDLKNKTCQPTCGDFMCSCNSRSGCNSTDPHMECGLLHLCECANGYTYDTKVESCQVSCNHFGCSCDAAASDCESNDPNMQCGLLHLCDCKQGYTYHHDKKECRLTCNALSAGAIAGIVCGVILENALVVIVTAFIARRRRHRKKQQQEQQ